MLPVVDRDGRRTGLHMITYCLTLLPVSLAPALLGTGGLAYLAGAAVLGLGFLATTLLFWRERTPAAARTVLRASLVYLPALLALMLLDRALPSFPLY